MEFLDFVDRPDEEVVAVGKGDGVRVGNSVERRHVGDVLHVDIAVNEFSRVAINHAGSVAAGKDVSEFKAMESG